MGGSKLHPLSNPRGKDMPEGPEIKITSLFINTVCQNRVFSGQPQCSAVTKNPAVDFNSLRYTIHSESRGKELALFLKCLKRPKKSLRLLFRFGMSGRFCFTPANDLHKHTHLSFTSTDEQAMALGFVDVRRFGSWQVSTEWGKDRGPDPMDNYDEFCSNIMENLEDPVFNKPVCEVLLNQKYFNGIGNYLRAEILFRAGIPPFIRASDILSSLTYSDLTANTNILQLCHSVPLEVVNLKIDKATDYVVTEEDYRAFLGWLQCYENPSMNNLRDHNNRTIWYQGEAGPLVPKAKKSRGKGKLKRPRDVTNEEVEEIERATKMKKESSSDHETDPSEQHVFETAMEESKPVVSSVANRTIRKTVRKKQSSQHEQVKRKKTRSRKMSRSDTDVQSMRITRSRTKLLTS